MIDRIFSAALTFCLLVAGTLAIGSALFERRAATPAVVQMPTVTVTGQRDALATETSALRVAATQSVGDCTVTRTSVPAQPAPLAHI